MWTWIPIRRSAQAILDEVLAQSLLVGMPPAAAIALAARIVPSYRLRRALREMEAGIQLNGRWDRAFIDTGVRVQPGLLESFRVGQERGHMAEELHAFAQSQDPNIARRVIRAAGQPLATVRFAQALSRILHDHSMTVAAVRDAGQVAANGSRRFLRVFDWVAEYMEDGCGTLADAVPFQPHYFDMMFCRFLEVSQTRQNLLLALRLLGGEEVAYTRSQMLSSQIVFADDPSKRMKTDRVHKIPQRRRP